MKTIISVCLVIVLFASCSKEGLDGDATLVVFLQHHGATIMNRGAYLDTVYVKFNSKELPGTKAQDYDTYFVGEAGEDHVHCEKLKWGDYFIYAAGFDTTMSKRVTGGMHVKIARKERKDELDVNVAVTE